MEPHTLDLSPLVRNKMENHICIASASNILSNRISDLGNISRNLFHWIQPTNNSADTADARKEDLLAKTTIEFIIPISHCT